MSEKLEPTKLARSWSGQRGLTLAELSRAYEAKHDTIWPFPIHGAIMEDGWRKDPVWEKIWGGGGLEAGVKGDPVENRDFVWRN